MTKSSNHIYIIVIQVPVSRRFFSIHLEWFHLETICPSNRILQRETEVVVPSSLHSATNYTNFWDIGFWKLPRSRLATALPNSPLAGNDLLLLERRAFCIRWMFPPTFALRLDCRPPKGKRERRDPQACAWGNNPSETLWLALVVIRKYMAWPKFCLKLYPVDYRPRTMMKHSLRTAGLKATNARSQGNFREGKDLSKQWQENVELRTVRNGPHRFWSPQDRRKFWPCIPKD